MVAFLENPRVRPGQNHGETVSGDLRPGKEGSKKMATMTIAQALASTDTNITVVDTPSNIASQAANAAFVARVASFTMSANAATGAADATKIAALAACRTRDFRSNLATPVAVIELSVAP